MTENISTEVEQKILEALGRKEWDYRTVEGLARETGVDPRLIQIVLDRRVDVVWKSSIPDPRGRDLYTLQARRSQRKEIWRGLSTFVGKLSS